MNQQLLLPHTSPRSQLTHLQNLQVPEIPLREPRPGDHAQLLPQRTEPLRLVCNDHHSLLHRAARHVLRSIQQLVARDLVAAAHAEYAARLHILSFALQRCLVHKCEVAELFRGGVCAVWKRHVGYEAPVIARGELGLGADPVLDFGATLVVEVDDTDEGDE